MQVRHGDVWLESVEGLPETARPKTGTVLAFGEVTGHTHRLLMDGLLYAAEDGTTYIRVPEGGVTLTHEEHGPVTVPEGDFLVRIQREYDPYERAARRVVD